MLIYAVATDQSIAALFIAGILPGLLSAAAYMTLIVSWALRRPQDAPRGAAVDWREKLRSLKGIWGVSVLVLLVIGSMYSGIATPTEAGAIGAFGALLIVWLRNVPLAVQWAAVLDTAKTSGMIFLIFVGTTYFGTFLTYSNLPSAITEALQALNLTGPSLVIMCLVILVPMGMFLDAISILLLCLPIMWPALKSFGIDGIWFGILVTKMLEVGQITPPVAMNVYMMKTVAPHVSLRDIYAGSLIFLAADMVTITLLFLFPWISTWLPSLMS